MRASAGSRSANPRGATATAHGGARSVAATSSQAKILPSTPQCDDPTTMRSAPCATAASCRPCPTEPRSTCVGVTMAPGSASSAASAAASASPAPLPAPTMTVVNMRSAYDAQYPEEDDRQRHEHDHGRCRERVHSAEPLVAHDFRVAREAAQEREDRE